MPVTDYMSNDVANGWSATSTSNGTINYGEGGFFESAKGILSGASDLLGTGLEGWIDFERLKGQAESYGSVQDATRRSYQTPSGTTNQPNAAGSGMSLPGNMTGRQLLIAGGVVLLAVYLMR
ncbi:hypothetical protein [Chromohalobacter israelensis]|uniref:hypothetical protein n=1 Tax=Chromohalobacter israelensis TaxID=141390 RepID=UPI00265BEAC6|nr:hypothetical protein [Chromohalobacter salexigens]MDO0946637.1 hypothetical protein [Chromohalobacter salexigens]